MELSMANDAIADMPMASGAQDLKGLCGLAQCIAFQKLSQTYSRMNHLIVKPFASQSLLGWWFGHAALSVCAIDREHTRYYILDPTFVQYADEKDDCGQNPYKCLMSNDNGANLAKDLISSGVARLDPINAMQYAGSFCLGKRPFTSEKDAYEFMKEPPPHFYHLSYGSKLTYAPLLR